MNLCRIYGFIKGGGFLVKTWNGVIAGEIIPDNMPGVFLVEIGAVGVEREINCGNGKIE